jgi:hypothetical protein
LSEAPPQGAALPSGRAFFGIWPCNNIINSIGRIPLNEIKAVFDCIIRLEKEQKKEGKP